MVDRYAVPPARYLCYLKESPDGAGMEHQVGNLERLLADAHCSGRLAVLPELRLAARHNLGFDRPWRWDDYFNLGESRLCDASDERPLPLVRSLPPGRLETLVLAPRAHLAAGAPAELVVRRIRSNSYFHDVPLRWLARLGGGWRGLLPGMPPLVLRLAPSQRVRALARPILDELQARRAGFAAVHVRRGDRLRGPVAYWTAPERIARRLRVLGVPTGTTVFFHSDERDPAFWRALERIYDVVRSASFPAAAVALPSAPGGPDNYLLYEVEKVVARAATVRIETFPRGAKGERTLVPAWAWVASRLPGKARHSMLRGLRAAVGERVWAAVRSCVRALNPGRRRAGNREGCTAQVQAGETSVEDVPRARRTG